MSYIKLSTLLLFLSTSWLYSQNNVQTNSPISTNDFISNNDYFHKSIQEKFSLHTNKTKYFSGESIWLKAYVANDINEAPSYGTSNLHINIYDSNKKLITNQLLYTNNGKAEGEIKLPIDLKSGNYFIQLETLSSQKSNNALITPFQIVNLKEDRLTENQEFSETDNEIDIQFYPESCISLENNENTFYFNINKNNHSFETKGAIYDQHTNEQVANFSSEKNGIGSFKLKISKDKAYYALIDGFNKDVKFTLPKSVETGISIHKKEKLETPSSIAFSVQTNKATLDQDTGKTFFAVIHRKGYVLSAIPITLEKKYYSYNLKLLKKDLFNGINTITIFNQRNEAISERHFYNNKREFIDIEVSKVSEINDSTSLNLKLTNSFIKTNLSISVLPEETKVYSNQNNILTDFLITPYINDKSTNSTSYFSNEMDLISFDHYLQTKTTKNLKTKVFPKNKSKEIKGENGLTISGNAIPTSKNETNLRVMLTSTENNIALVTRLKPNRSFAFDSLLLKQSSSYKLAIIDIHGKLLDAKFTLNKDKLNYRLDTISSINLKNFEFKKETKNSNYYKKQSSSLNTVQELDAVVLKGKKKKIVMVDDYPDPTIAVSAMSKTYAINENKYASFNSVMDVIKDLPGVGVDNNSTTIKSLRGEKTFNGGSRNKEMAVYMNGVRVSDFNILREISATEILEVKVNASGAGYGLNGFGGVIILKTKFDSNYRQDFEDPDSKYKTGMTQFGFSIPEKSFENHDLIFPTANSTKFYSTLDWIPNIDLLPNTDNLLTVFNEGNKDIKLIINGCNENGDLIYQTISIPSSSD